MLPQRARLRTQIVGGCVTADFGLTTWGCGAPSQSPCGKQRQPLLGVLVQDPEYRPQLPRKPFACLLSARRWVTELVHWYNGAHRHSSIGFVTPDQRHAGLDQALLNARAQVYEKARQANPLRWSGQVRDWSYVDTVHLNPDTPQNKDPQTIQKAA